MVLLTLACAARFVVPDLAGSGARVWPPPPDVARVRAVGDLRPKSGRFARPMDVACTGDHRLAVADPDAGAVWVIDAHDGRGFLAAAPTGSDWRAPVGVAFDGAGGLLIVDADRAGVFRARADRSSKARALLPEGRLQRPTAVVQRGDGTVLVVDAAAHQVVRLEREGGVSPVSGARGEAGQGFNYPVDLAFGAQGELYVADAMNASLDRVGEDGKLGLVAGGGNGSLVRPKGVAVDPEGHVHVVDGGMQHVEVYTPEGRLLGRYAEPGTGEGQLALPAGICIDADRHIFVADSLNGRIAVFRLEAP